MKCVRAQDLFSAYMENAVEPPLRVAFEQHLAECPLCKADYEKFNAAVMMLEELPEVETPPAFHASVMARIEQERLVAPRRVKWWNINWQQAFTIRVPVRAAAMGFAVLLLMVLMFQLTPVGHIAAGIFPFWNSKQVEIGPAEAPKHPDATSTHSLIQSGLSVTVVDPSSSGASGVYKLQLKSESTTPIQFGIYMLSENTSGNVAPDAAYQAGFVRYDEPFATRIDVDKSADSQVAEINWTFSGRSYSRFIFLPAQFDAQAAGKNLQLSFNDTSIFNALKTISGSYGVVIMASGDLGRKINYAGVASGNPEEALYGSVVQADMIWKAVDSSVYMVEPGD